MENERDTVLFVDDEPSILNAIFRVTADEQFKAIFANSAQEALQVFEKHKISVIVTDMRMPGMDGLALLKIIRQQYPATMRMVLSGYTQISQVLATINQGEIFQFVPKPWQMAEELLMPIRRAIDRYNLELERQNLQNSLAKKNQVYQKILHELEQRKANEKKELINLKRLNHWIFDFWKRQNGMLSGKTEVDREVIDRYVDLIEEIQLMYIGILPTVCENKTLAEMLGSINRECGGRIAFDAFDERQQDTRVLAGYPSFLAMTFKILVYLLAPNSQSSLACDVAVNTSDEGPPFVEFSLRQPAQMVLPMEQGRLKIGCSLLNEIGKIYNVLLITKVTDDNFILTKVVWQLS